MRIGEKLLVSCIQVFVKKNDSKSSSNNNNKNIVFNII